MIIFSLAVGYTLESTPESRTKLQVQRAHDEEGFTLPATSSSCARCTCNLVLDSGVDSRVYPTANEKIIICLCSSSPPGRALAAW
jgi:hypothetical protein